MPPPQPTSARDRTPDFLQLVERLQKQLGASASSSNGLAGGGQASKPGSLQQHTEFAQRAAGIGHRIHEVSTKLQKLAQLAKRTSMFDDPTAEVEALTGVIKEDLKALESSIAELQRTHGRKKEDSKQSLDHTHTVVNNLRSKLKDANQDFMNVLTVRSDALKHAEERRSRITIHNPEKMPLLPTVRPQHHAGPSGLGHPQHSAREVAMQQDAQSSSQPTPSFMQHNMQQITLQAPQDTYLDSRAEALRNVTSMIAEVHTMFTQLAELVQEQGQIAIRIDDNVGDALAHVTDAQTQLVKYLHTISSNRWLIMKVFSVLLVFMVIFIMFIA